MYPAGTKIVITWARLCARVSIGETHVVGSRVRRKGQNAWDISKQRSTVNERDYQELTDVPGQTSYYTHPIDWMKPFADPDEESLYDNTIEDLIEDIVELTK